ncbi:hypothetical protein TPMD03_5 [Thiohalocapsa phage LS06-2018-MD03]|nr:hypothetical protein TPMD03_5 [Thiohalocapsa phage LS06-2018-MD03]
MDTVKIDIIKKWLTYDSPLKFEVIYSKSGVARIYISDRMTSFKAGGYGYCKESSVIAKFINELIGSQNYNPKIYGNRRVYNGNVGKYYKYKATLSGGTGFNSIQASFNSLKGCKLTKLYSGVNSDVYELKVNKQIKSKIERGI